MIKITQERRKTLLTILITLLFSLPLSILLVGWIVVEVMEDYGHLLCQLVQMNT